MGIKGLTNQTSFPQLGFLRKGAIKPEQGNKPGADLSYFRFDTDDADAEQIFLETYGNEPRAVRVFLPFATADENFEAWKEAWTASSLQHRCDGETCVRWLDTKTNKYMDTPKPCPGGCKQVGRLKVIIPELRRMAYVTALTTSIHDIIQIHANLAALQEAVGSIRGIPLILRRVEREISTPDNKGGRARRKKWLLTIDPQADWVSLQLSAMAQAALPEAGQRALNAAPDFTDDDDVLEAEAVPQLDESYIKAITELARITNTNLSQQLKKAGVESLADLPQERADKLLAALEQKAEAMSHPVAEESVGQP